MLDVFIEVWINSHMFAPNSEPLLMFFFIFDADDKGDASGVLLHNLDHEIDGQMNALNNQRLIPPIEVLNYLFQFSLN